MRVGRVTLAPPETGGTVAPGAKSIGGGGVG
jgi:hypothetical protein